MLIFSFSEKLGKMGGHPEESHIFQKFKNISFFLKLGQGRWKIVLH